MGCDQHAGCAVHVIEASPDLEDDPAPHPLDDLRRLIVDEVGRLHTITVAARSWRAYRTAEALAREAADHLEFMAMELQKEQEG